MDNRAIEKAVESEEVRVIGGADMNQGGAKRKSERAARETDDGYFSGVYGEWKTYRKSKKEPTRPVCYHHLVKKWVTPLRLNTMGVKKYDERAYEEALELFHQAVEADRGNVNALKHCRFVYKELRRESEAAEMSRSIMELLNGENGPVIEIRSGIELAFAKNGVEYLCQYLSQSIDAVGNVISRDELDFWKLQKAQCYMWSYMRSTRLDKPDTLEMLKQCVELFCQISIGENSRAEIKAIALCLLSELIRLHYRKTQTAHIFDEAVRVSQVMSGSMNHEDYVAKAYVLDPSSPIVCHHRALSLMRNKMLDEAQAMIEKMVENWDPEAEDYQCFALRGELLLKRNKERKNKAQLEQAIDDLSLFTKYVFSAHGFGLLGMAHHYHLLAIHGNSTSTIPEESMKPALLAFDNAVDMLGHKRSPFVYIHHAECLADFGLLRLAVESVKRAVEHDDPRTTYYMYKLMSWLFQLYQNEKKPDHVMSECVFWMDLTCYQYGEKMPKKFPGYLTRFYKEHRPVIARLVRNLDYNRFTDTAALFPQHIPDFRRWCPHQPKGIVPPPAPRAPYNRQHKTFDFAVLHSESKTPWLYYSLLTKLELQHGLKGCVTGRDVEAGDVINENVTAKFVNVLVQEAADTDNGPPEGVEQQRDAATTDATTNTSPGAMEGDAWSANSTCIILILNRDFLRSMWFGEDGKPSRALQRIVSAHAHITVLKLDDVEDWEDLVAGREHQLFDWPDLIQWDKLAKHVKCCCGLSPEDEEKYNYEVTPK